MPVRRIVWLVVGCMVCQMGTGLFYASRALSPDLLAELDWSRTLWSSGMTAMLLVSSTAQAFVGAACVRFGVRPVLLLSVASLVASMLVMASVRTPWAFYGALMLLALGSAGVGDVSIGGVITRWFDRGRSLALGFAFVGSNLGAVVFVQGVTSTLVRASWREAALVIGLAAGVLILPFVLFVVRDPRPGEADRVGDPETVDPDPALLGGGVPDDSLSTAMRRPAFWIFLYTIFCYALVQLGMVDHLILYLVDLGYSNEEAAGALQLAVGVGIVSKLGSGIVASRLSARTVLIANTLVLAASLALVPFAADPRALAAFGLLFGVSTAARDVLVALFVGETFGARFFSQIYGVLMLAFLPAGSLGPLLLAGSHDLLGSYRPGFLLCLGLVASALVGLWFIRTARPVVRA